MKPSLSPLNFIGDSNLTEQNIHDFLEASVKHMRNATAQNRTYVSNDTTDLANLQPSDCIGYCDSSQLRHIFEEYKHYHGFVSLVVSVQALSFMVSFTGVERRKTLSCGTATFCIHEIYSLPTLFQNSLCKRMIEILKDAILKVIYPNIVEYLRNAMESVMLLHHTASS